MPEIRQSWQAIGSETTSVYSRSPSGSATAAATMISHQATPASGTTTTASLEDHQQGHEYKTVSRW